MGCPKAEDLAQLVPEQDRGKVGNERAKVSSHLCECVIARACSGSVDFLMAALGVYCLH